MFEEPISGPPLRRDYTKPRLLKVKLNHFRILRSSANLFQVNIFIL